MDLLAGYGSDSESDSDGEHFPAPQPSAAPASSLVNAAPRSGISLPPPKSHASQALTAVEHPLSTFTVPSDDPGPATSVSGTSTGLPTDFFDCSTSSSAAAAQSALPADFFQTATHAAPPPSANELAPEMGPRRPNRPPPKFDEEPEAPSAGLWSNLPKPKARKIVTLNLGFKLRPAASTRPRTASDDEDDIQPAKRSRAPGGKSALIDFLPAPIYSTSRGSLDLTPDASTDPTPGPHGDSTYPESTSAEPSYDVMYSNEAYRADQPAYDYPMPTSLPDPSHAFSSPGTHPYHATHRSQPHPSSYPTHSAAGPSGGPDLPAPGPNATAEEHDIFAQALRAERERVSRTSGSKAAEEVRFVELTQQQLKYVPPAAKETHDALKDALGSEYALEIRSQAKKFLGSKQARRKHQIGTLFHNAQVMELELMEKRAQSAKSKKETAAKYGW